tara:strand:+ start:5173 stop:6108 length:936 start_codon:yes stop_codon:yes gene_type:complete
MMIDFNDYQNFLEKANTHTFKENDGIFIYQKKLIRDVTFGIDKNGFLIIIIPIKNQISGFQIRDFLTLKDQTKFYSENQNILIEGSPLIFKRKNIIDHHSFLSQIILILESKDYLINLSQFLDILQKAHNARNKFNAPSFFAEACTVLFLLKYFPDIANQWGSSSNAIIDIASSEEHPAIEVKSTLSNEERIHTISIHQIRYFQKNPNTLLSSVIIFTKEDGISCKSICEKIISKLNPNDNAYKFLKGLLISHSDISNFTENCFDEGMTLNNIQIHNPKFNDFPLDNPPIWLISGNLKICMDSIPQIDIFK